MNHEFTNHEAEYIRKLDNSQKKINILEELFTDLTDKTMCCNAIKLFELLKQSVGKKYAEYKLNPWHLENDTVSIYHANLIDQIDRHMDRFKNQYNEQQIDNTQLNDIAARVDEEFATSESLLSKRLVDHLENSDFKKATIYHCEEGDARLPMERHEFSLPIGDADLSPAQERFILNMVSEMKELEFAIKHNLVDIPGEAKLPKSPSNSKSRELEDFAKAIDEQLEKEAFIADITKAATLEELFDIERERTPNYVHVDLTNYKELKLFATKTQLDIRQLIVDGVDGLFYDTRNDKIIIKYINGRSEFPSITEYYKKPIQKFESPGVFATEKQQ